MPRENEEIRSKKEIVFRLFSYLKDYKKESVISIILMGLITISNNLNPYLMKIAIDNNIKNKDIKGLVYIGLFLVVVNIFTSPITLAKIFPTGLLSKKFKGNF